MSLKSEALSPWGMPPAHAVEIKPLRRKLDVAIAIPGSKSFTNRALVMAAVAKGVSHLRSPLFSDDSYWCVDALQKLGLAVNADKAGDVISVTGTGSFRMQGDAPYIGSAGTIARFLPGVLAARAEGKVTLTSSSQLAKRPVAEMIAALRQLGAEIEMPAVGSFPMTITGGSLKGGEATISGKISSQFISGLLIAAPLAQESVTLHITDHIVQADYVRMTLAMMADFGIKVAHDDALSWFKIEPQDYLARDLVLEADASTSTYFFALAAATQSRVTVTNLNPQTLQPDFGFINYLAALGCDVEKTDHHVTVTGPARLKGNQVFDFNPCSDSTPAFIAVAPYADGVLQVTNVEHIRKHESDRISVMRQTLENAGIGVVEAADGLTVTPGVPQYVTVDPHDDHRMAMAFSIMAVAGAGGKILDPACVSKTCPDFFHLLQKLGISCVVEA
ncbi:MAG TPA: 3-phosphoshikimate 1-carboxyvinyltransferase [Micavibrio sp.]